MGEGETNSANIVSSTTDRDDSLFHFGLLISNQYTDNCFDPLLISLQYFRFFHLNIIMPPASPLAIATSSVQRLIKEEASYHRELEQQTKRLQKLESEGPGADDEENHAFLVKQERQAADETKAVFPMLKEKISDAVAKLEQLIVEEGNKGDNSNVEQLTAAKEAISAAKTAMREIS